jgi:hypothetical protein
LGRDWPRIVGWGYLLSVAALVTVLAVALVLIFLPLVLGRVRIPSRETVAPVILFFGGVGLGFMLLEIALFQKASLLLGAPTLAAGVVVGSMLLGAGLGSIVSRRMQPWPDRLLLVVMVLVAGLGWGCLMIFQEAWRAVAGWPILYRGAAAALPAALVAFLMGMPLPEGLRRLRPLGLGAVAWAWGLNGFASVAGSVAAPLVAMHFGFRPLVLGAGLCYVVAGMVSRALGSEPAPKAGGEDAS